MSRSRIVLLFSLLATLGACGGRSSLRYVTTDGGQTGGKTASDAKTDGRPTDGKLDGGGTDGIRADGGLPSDANRDGIRTDGGLGDAPRVDGRPVDGPSTDGPLADRPRTDVLPATDARDAAPRTLTSIEISPATITVVVGIPFTSIVVTGVYSDNTTENLTSTATLTSSDSATVQITGRTLTGLKAGSATVNASVSGRTASARVTVSAAALQSLSIDGLTTVLVNQSILATATGVFADGTKQDVSAQATWASSDPTIATITPDSSGKAKISGIKAGTVSITVTLQGVSTKASLTVTASPMARIDITPVQPILQRGVTQEFKATATFEDRTTADVTLQATWTTSAAGVASVTKNATNVTVTAQGAGNATITATVGTVQGATSVTVTAPTLQTITVTPATWTANVGGTQNFTAQATYSDNSTADVTLSATWSSTAATTVAVSNAPGQKGRATALAVGTAQITASLDGINGSAQATIAASPLVSIAITPNPIAIVLGLKSPLKATGTYQNQTTQDLTSQVGWAVKDTAIATVSNAAGTTGQVTGVAVGSTTITATLNGIQGTATLTVSQPVLKTITVGPATVSIAAGKTQQYTATGNYDNGATADLTTQATWTTSNIAVAQISNASGSNGLVTSLIAGTATITATFGDLSGTAALTVTAPALVSINITPATASIAVQGTQAYVVRAVYQNGTTTIVTNQATFVSSNTGVATINTTGGGGGPGGGGGRGVATGVAAGSTTITATYQTLTDTATLTVTAPVTLVDFTVTPVSPPAILVGATQQFQGNAIFSDGTSQNVTGQATWTTSNANVASISNGGGGGPGGGGGRGQATGIGAGTATITATYQGQTATATITVRDPQPTGLVVTPASASIRVNGTQQFTATLVLEDGTSQNVTNSATWTTSAGTVASISSGGGGGFPGGGGGGGRGLATGIGAGTATITATYSGFSDSATLSVTAATVKQLVVTPEAPTAYVNQTQAFVATAVFDDGTTAVVTGSSTWSSSDPTVAMVTTAGTGGGPGGIGGGGGGGGVATTLAVGKTTITASYGGLTGTAILSVVDPALSFIQVTPTNTNLPEGGSEQFTATAVYADNSVRNITNQATWSSSNATVALIGTTGRATALAAGTSTISATYQGVSGSTVLTVAASVASLSILPATATTVLGIPVAFSATATLSNNAVIGVTGAATWVTSDPTIATILSGSASAGVATPVKAGTVTITATYLGKSTTATLTISPATLSSIAITPAPLSVVNGGSLQLIATGTYSDGATRPVTNYATWLSSATAVATVSNAAGARGLLNASSVGTSTISAIFQGVTGTTSATVTAAQ